MAQWLQTPQGACLLAWQRSVVNRCVADAFGYHALQLGGLQLPALEANRMPHRWRAMEAGVPAFEGGNADLTMPSDSGVEFGDSKIHFMTDARALPFPESSIDLLVLPHTLETSPDPFFVLQEVTRVLMHEGRVVVLGLNPVSWWGLRHWRSRLSRRLGGRSQPFLPVAGTYLPAWHVADLLEEHGLLVTAVEHGCYQLASGSEKWLARQQWLNHLGGRFWPALGAAYCLTAIKRAESPHLMGKPWKEPLLRSRSPAAAAAPQSEALRDPPNLPLGGAEHGHNESKYG